MDTATIELTGLVSTNIDANNVRVITCTVTEGPDQGSTVAVGLNPTVIGADGSCALVLSDPKVSRTHVELSVHPNGVAVRDLKSRNGTYHQGSRINDAIVSFGSLLRIGETQLRLDAVASPRVAPSQRQRFGELVGDSVSMREAFALLELAARSDCTVVIEGESGTGKELAARALHDHSQRAQAPMVVVDCSAIAEPLIDSHLFGHVKGAFTGAVTDRAGAFVQAHNGTLFLDEIGELPLHQQAKLLRVIEDGTVQPVGSDRRRSVDVRVVAATHRDLRAMVDRNTFRFDLYHRLSVVHLKMPRLRDRLEDLPTLIRHFYRGRGVDSGTIAGANLGRLNSYNWPGNVRELRNVLERAWVLAAQGNRSFECLALWLGDTQEPMRGVDTWAGLGFKEAKERVVTDFEYRYLYALALRFDFNITRAAEHAGLNRKSLRELLAKHGINKP
ncbi:MAG: sigma 54-interacting transcriptional regulator [Myxococcota bacterium]